MSDFKQKLPNYLTILRVILIPFLMMAFYFEKGEVKIITTSIFLLASISDFLDGYLSRKWGVTSRFGAMLDPIADKLLIATALCLVITEESWLVLPAVVIICREIFISGLREFLGKNGDVQMPVTNLAKWKTASQMIATTLLLLTCGSIIDITVTINILYYLGCIVFWLSAGLTLYTGYKYYMAAKEQNLL